MTGSIGPKPNPRPLILHVDSDTNIPYRLAESDSLYLGGTLYAETVSATNYLNVCGTGGGGGITSIEVTGDGTSLIFTSTPTKVTIKTLTPRPTSGGKNVFAVPDGGDGTVEIGFKEPGEGGEPIPTTYGGTGQTSLALVNVNSFAGTGVFETTSHANSTFLTITNAATTYQAKNTNLTDLGSLTGVNKVILKDNSGRFAESDDPVDGAYLRYAGAGVFDWDSPTGAISIPVSISQGGTNATGPFTNGSVMFFSSAKFQQDTNFNYSVATGKLSVPQIDLTTPLAVIDGGTGATALGDIPLTSFAGTLTVAKGGTGQTSLSLVNVNSFAGTGVFDTTANTAASYQPKDGDLTSFAALTGTGFVYRSGTDTIITKSSPLPTTDGGTGQTSLGAVNVNSFAGTGVFETTAYARNTYIENSFDAANQILVYNGFAPIALDPGDANTFLKYNGSNLVWADITGTVSFPIPISQGGTNTTTTPGSNGRLIYYNNSLTAYDTTNTLSFAAGTLNVPSIDLTTPLAVADGGTGQTSLGSVSVDSFAGTLSVAKGGTGQTSLASVNVTSFAGTGTFETTGYARNTYETTSYARSNYTTTATNLTSFAGTLSVVKGGTGVTALDNITLDSFGGILSPSKGGTGKSSLNQLNVNSFAGTGVFETTANAGSTYIPKSVFTKANQLLYSNGSTQPAGFDPPTGNSYLNYDGSILNWATGNLVSQLPIPITDGGTNTTGPFTSGRVLYFTGTKVQDNSNLTFNGTTLTANTLALTNKLATSYGGTGATALGDITLDTFGGTLSVAKGGTGQTSLASVNINSFAGTGVFETTGYSRNTFETTGYARNTYETTSYARSNYTTVATNLTSFAGTLSIAKGGTGVTTLTDGRLLYVTGTSVTSVAAPSNNNYLKYTTAGGYSWDTPAGGALDPTLQAIADTPTAANVLIYFSSVDGAASASFTQAGRAFARTVSLNAGDMFYYNGTDISKIAKPTATDEPGALVWSQTDQAPKWITSKTQGHVLQINASNEVEWNVTP